MATINPNVLNCPAERATSKKAYLRLTISEITQSIADNKTTVKWNITFQGTRYVNLYGAKCTLGGKVLFDKHDDFVKTDWYVGDVLASGTTTFNNNSDGSLTLTATLTQLFYNTSWAWGDSRYCESATVNMVCSTIPRAAKITAAPNFDDEHNPVIYYQNNAGSAVTSLQACLMFGDTVMVSYRDIPKNETAYTFLISSAEREAMRIATTGTSRSITFRMKTVIGGNTLYSDVIKTFSIVNANPTFTASQATYADTNSATVNITEDDQKIVQNKSTLRVTITAATPKKGASISRYSCTINGVTKTRTTAGTIDFGIINSNTNLNMSTTVTDSRGLTTTVTRTITMLPYSSPNAIVTLNRLNNYEATTYLTVDGKISELDGKNAMTIRYRYKLNGGSYGSYTTIPDNVRQTIILDSNNEYVFEVRVQDSLGTTYTKTYTLSKGVFPLFIDTQKNAVSINTFPENDDALRVKGGYLTAEDGLRIGNEVVDDYIVESGENGIWHYTKWHSGRAELYGRKQVTISSDIVWSAPIHAAEPASDNIDYPFVFVGIPNEQVTVRGSTNACFAYAEAGSGLNTNAHSGNYRAAKVNAFTAGTYLYFDLSVVGKWR